MQDSARAHLHDHKDVEHAEPAVRVTKKSQASTERRVVLCEGAPRLSTWPAYRTRARPHVPPYRARRDTNPKLHKAVPTQGAPHPTCDSRPASSRSAVGGRPALAVGRCEEQILGCEVRAWPQHRQWKLQDVAGDAHDRADVARERD